MSDIDREVAEKVMGWTARNVAGDVYDWTSDGEHTWFVGSWSPSTRIDHAWEVVKKMNQTKETEIMLDYSSGEYLVSFGIGGPNLDAEADGIAETAPLAICKAALAAVESTNG